MTASPESDPSLSGPVASLVWSEDGAPRSRLFDDVYFSKADGLAESRAVFLEGCGLPDAWRGHDRFVVGELGFGTGLNILALMDLWRRSRELGARLHVFSVEAHPLSVDDARRALAAWPELAEVAAPLLAQWPRRSRGFHRLGFPAFGATLDLAVMDAAEALQVWTGHADAWFLDGFSPAKNPAMWSEAVMQGLAARSAPAARAATFTVAGAVRRGLEANGFTVEKQPGFGQKRQRLEARRTAAAPTPQRISNARTIAVVGAGIAGAALVRAFEALGFGCIVIEAETPGAGASGNPAALVMPRLDAGGGDVAQLYAQAFARAADLYAETGAIVARGAIHLEVEAKDASRFDRIAASNLFEAGAVTRLDARAAGARLGEPTSFAALAFAEALSVEPAAVLDAWLARAERRTARVTALVRQASAWRLLAGDGEEIARADIVCLAASLAAAALLPPGAQSSAPLAPVRGQVSHAVRGPDEAQVEAGIWAGYLIPTRRGLLFGATHDRGEMGCEARPADHVRNLDLLRLARPVLAARLRPENLEGRAGLRAATPDFLPLAGAVEGMEGVFLLSGLGSRGFCAAPLLAEHVAALASGAPSPLPATLQAIVDPARFQRRREHKGRPRV